jgi:hypothetical protein
VERADVRGGIFDRRPDAVVYRVDRPFGLVGDLDIADIHAVELLGERPECDVALGADAVEDIPDVVAHGVDPRIAVEQRLSLDGCQRLDASDLHTGRSTESA